MLRNHLIVAIRNLLRHKTYSLINVIGLAVGMTCCVLILLYIQDELSYDQNHKNAGRIYRVLRETRATSGTSTINTGTEGALAPALLHDFPEVLQAIRVINFGGRWVSYKDKGFAQTVCLADANILGAFTLPLVTGDPKTALEGPSSILVTEEMARKYFGTDDPIGKVITVEDRYLGGPYKVSGVLRDVPRNSTLRFDFLTSTVSPYFSRVSPSSPLGMWRSWAPYTGWRPIETYILLPNGYSHMELEQKLPAFMARSMGEEIRANNTYHLQRLSRIYLYSNVDYGIPWDGDITYTYLFSAIALLILLIACINFMNLATARSANRAKEVGLRKVMGAHRRQLIQQFLGESILLSFLALLLTVGLVEAALPEFSRFTEKKLELIPGNWPVLLGLPCIALCVGLVAGSYPAFFLSGMQPATMLKSTLKGGSRSAWFRKGLVVLQFFISILLITSTAVVYQQLRYVSTKKLGFDREQMVILPLFVIDRSLTARCNVVKNEFLKHPGVLKATASHSTMGYGGQMETVRPEGIQGNEWQMRVLGVDEDFLDTYGIELVAGRHLSRNVASDSTAAFILNETAVKQLRWTDPIGKRFEWPQTGRRGTVVGVVKDFHNRSLHETIAPMVICKMQNVFNILTLKISGKDIPATMSFLRGKWGQFIPNRPFEYTFLDEDLNGIYRSEKRFGQISLIFSVLAIFLACLGLSGLAAFAAERRTKEIGIRKVLGASIPNVVLLLLRDFVKLVAAGTLVAWPVAYYTMGRWLQDFAYRIDLNLSPFLFGVALTLTIASVTVGYQAFRAANANPVDALRYE